MRRKRIHITGAHRSGTTLLCALMATCFDIDVVPPDEVRLRAPLPPGGRIVCTKCTDETDYAFWLLPLDPDLHILHIMRDPRDVIVSKYAPDPGRYFTNLRSWRRNRPRPFWRRHPRAHFISYERLVREPDAVQDELAQAMPFLRRVCAFSEFAVRARETAEGRGLYWSGAMHSIRPPDPESIGRWRAHPDRVKGQMARHGDLSRDLIEMGLEKDDGWRGMLDRAGCDLASSHIPEHETIASHVTRLWRNALGVVDYMRRRRREHRLSDTSQPSLQ